MSAVDLVALSLALEGRWGIGPLVCAIENGKQPIVRWATWRNIDRDTQRASLARHRGNVGVCTGLLANGLYLVVIDVDLYKPGAHASLDALLALGLHSNTVVAHTARGGVHYYCLTSKPLRSGALDGFDGVDVKCVGGFVVIEPSTIDGAPYAWELSSHPDDVPLAMLPATIEARIPLESASRNGERPARALDQRDEDAIACLAALGFHSRVDHEGWVAMTRPDKDARDGWSITIGTLDQPGAVFMHSTSVPWLPSGPHDLRELRKLAGVAPPEARIGANIRKATEEQIAEHEPPPPTVPTLAMLMNAAPTQHDWLIPGLIEKGDRTIVTARGGMGKSTFFRQVACGAALGCDPFTADTFTPTFDPVRTLIIDLENSPRQLRREFEKVRTIVGAERFARLAELVYCIGRTEGVVLNDARDVQGRADREWLDAILAACTPDVLAIGPLYKMQRGNPNDEEAARDLALYLDRLRGKYGFAALIEAHPAKAESALMPAGSSVWERWPEFGLYLAADGRLLHWRGPREERAWPEAFVAPTPADRKRENVAEGVLLWRPLDGAAAASPIDRKAERITVAKLSILRVARRARRALSRDEMFDLADGARDNKRAAFAQLVDADAFTVITEDRERENGRPYPVKLYTLTDDWRADDDPARGVMLANTLTAKIISAAPFSPTLTPHNPHRYGHRVPRSMSAALGAPLGDGNAPPTLIDPTTNPNRKVNPMTDQPELATIGNAQLQRLAHELADHLARPLTEDEFRDAATELDEMFTTASVVEAWSQRFIAFGALVPGEGFTLLPGANEPR